MKYIDYYEVLGVPRTATEKEIKQAYRKLARQHHPDLHQGDAKAAAEDKFKLINEAYEVLGDAEKREKYDKLGMNWQTGQEFDPGPAGGFHYYGGEADGIDFSDFFASMFGDDLFRKGRTSGRRSLKGENIEAEITLTIDELIHGAEKDLRLSSPNVCAACEGRRITQHGVCRACGGLGITDETKTIKVNIPAGLSPGASIRLKGLGGKGSGGAPDGDLYLHVKVDAHGRWRLVNQADLEGDLSIYPEQAVLGDKLSLPTPYGTVVLKIHAGAHTGQRLRLKGKGLKRPDGQQGDLYLKLQIDLPPQLSPAETELYRQIQALRSKEV